MPRIRRHLHARTQHNAADARTVNVTPMIDVVMCLIVFYLIVGELVIEQREELTLAQTHIGIQATQTHDKELAEAIVVNVLAQPSQWTDTARVVIDTVEIPNALALEDAIQRRVRAWRLEQHGSSVNVEIRADHTVPFSAMQPIIKACSLGGQTNVWITAERARTPAPNGGTDG